MTHPILLASPQRSITATSSSVPSSTDEVYEERLPCGTVYTWNCAGEMYGIECALCEERPLCTLTEFADHMEVWHRSWCKQMDEEPFSGQGNELADVHEDLMQEVLAELTATGEIELIASPEDLSIMPTDDMKEKKMVVINEIECEELENGKEIETIEESLESVTQEKATVRLQSQCFENMCGDIELKMDLMEAKVNISPTVEPFEEIVLFDSPQKIANQDLINDHQVPTSHETKIILPNNEKEEECLESKLRLTIKSINTDVQNQEQNFQYVNQHSASDQKKSSINDPISVEKKLTAKHVSKLIELYRAQPRLWNQSHAEFGDTELCRQSWQAITNSWNKHCRRDFTITDVRIRVSTLCQRFMKQRERLEAEGELDECSKFLHYESLTFLFEQQTLQNRRKIFESENRKLITIYKRYPVLWHTGHRTVRCPNERSDAYRAISDELKAIGINLTAFGVQRRLMSLRKCYRLEKIRYLHSLVDVEQNSVHTTNAKEFESDFKLYRDMTFLHEHINPYVCAGCGKIFKNLVTHREHVNNWNKSCWQAYDTCDEDELSKIEKRTQESDGIIVKNLLPATVNAGWPLLANEYFQCNIACRQAEEDEKTVVEVPNITLGMVQPSLTTKQTPITLSNSAADLAVSQPTEKPKDRSSEIFNGSCNDIETAALPKAEQPAELVVKVQCEQLFTYNLHLRDNMSGNEKQQCEALAEYKNENIHIGNIDASKINTTCEALTATADNEEEDSNNNNYNKDDKSDDSLPHYSHNDRLSVRYTHKLITLYKAQPTLWDPNHLDFHSRKQRRLAWNALTAELNSSCQTRYSWQMLHRKLTDFTKYYKREKQRIEDPLGGCTKWYFYNDFHFLDDALVVNNELQKTLQQRDNNLKIIEAYKAHPQLWCTDHPDYSKRKQRQRHIDAMCTRLQEECNLQITPERLKTRLIDFRCQYRQVKQQRLRALHRDDATDWKPHYEYYDVLKFLEHHVSPFTCTQCNESFKRRTEYLLHERNVHEETLNGVLEHREFSNDNWARQLCHICGQMFSMRNNLLAHLKRHLGERKFACNTCPKKFFNSTALSVHMRSHTKELPFVCEHCARGFVNASKLNQHVKRHRNQRDYSCNRCDKAFYTASERDRHLRSHLNIRDKICPICGRAFVVGSAYYAHLNLHRDNKRYGCDNCSQRFAQYAGLYKHRKRCKRNEQ